MTELSAEALFAPLGAARRLLLAVSGGPDSTALLWLAARWAQGAAAAPIAAATVDHGLRAEAAREAVEVGGLCSRLGIPHTILTWSGEKPKTRVQERAREARYRLLIAHARAIDADTVVTAHHLDDQAETVLFRLMRGTGIAGLAGIAPLSMRDGVAIARPLLEVAKSELVALCDAAGVGYVSDPSNADCRYARARLRKLVAEEGLDAAALARLARRAAQVEAAIASQVASAEQRLRLVETGECDAAALLGEPLEIAQRLLTEAIAAVAKRDPGRIGLEKMEALTAGLVGAHREGAHYGANVAGALVRLGANRVRIENEPPRGPRRDEDSKPGDASAGERRLSHGYTNNKQNM